MQHLKSDIEVRKPLPPRAAEPSPDVQLHRKRFMNTVQLNSPTDRGLRFLFH